MDVLSDVISPAAFWTMLLTLHRQASVGLLGAVPPQALAAPAPRGAGDGVLNQAPPCRRTPDGSSIAHS